MSNSINSSPLFAVRPMIRADIPAVHAVLMGVGMDSRSSWSRITLEQLQESMFAEGAGGFVALDGGEAKSNQIVGCVGYRPDGKKTLTLNKLAVLPTTQKHGLGRQLVQAVENNAENAGFKQVLLAVSQFNLEVIPFYEKLGYMQSNEPYAFANECSPKPIVMLRDLRKKDDQHK